MTWSSFHKSIPRMPFVKKNAKKSFTVRRATKPQSVSLAMYRKLQAMIPKPEHKRLATVLTPGSVFGQLIGLFAGNANSGHLIANVTPDPVIGAAINGRIGAEIMVKKLKVRGQIWGQSSQVGPTVIRLVGFRCKGANYASSASAIASVFYANPLVNGAAQSIYDYQSLPQIDGSKAVDIFFDKKMTVKQDGASGATFISNVNVEIDVTKDMLVAYDTSGLVILRGAMYFVAFADRGNTDTSFAAGSVTQVVDTAVSTGLNIAVEFSFEYVDN